MRRISGRGRAALFLGAIVVVGLAQELHDYHLDPLSGSGMAITILVLSLAALMISFIMHAGDAGC